MRNSARWAFALALGLRQGEALRLKWSDVDLDAGTLVVRRGRLRPRWRHGCDGTCGRKFGGHCRVPDRDDTAETKSRAGRRTVGLPAELVKLLRTHRTEQDREREQAAQLWQEGDWLFATPTGRPVNPRTDYDEWKRLLERAGVREGRLHDARHTAATVLLLLGVPERAVNVLELRQVLTKDVACLPTGRLLKCPRIRGSGRGYVYPGEAMYRSTLTSAASRLATVEKMRAETSIFASSSASAPLAAIRP